MLPSIMVLWLICQRFWSRWQQLRCSLWYLLILLELMIVVSMIAVMIKGGAAAFSPPPLKFAASMEKIHHKNWRLADLTIAYPCQCTGKSQTAFKLVLVVINILYHCIVTIDHATVPECVVIVHCAQRPWLRWENAIPVKNRFVPLPVIVYKSVPYVL